MINKRINIYFSNQSDSKLRIGSKNRTPSKGFHLLTHSIVIYNVSFLFLRQQLPRIYTIQFLSLESHSYKDLGGRMSVRDIEWFCTCISFSKDLSKIISCVKNLFTSKTKMESKMESV